MLLADDDRQRYSAWYSDNSLALQQRGLAASSLPTLGTNQVQSVTHVVDLTLALITPQPIEPKPMHVRLTKRNQCSDLRGYLNQLPYGAGSSGGGMMVPPSSMPHVGSSSAASPGGYCNPISSATYFSTIIVLLLTAYQTLLPNSNANQRRRSV